MKEEFFEQSNVQFRAHYPDNPDYHYETRLVRLNLDKEREKDLNSGNGFIIKKAQNIKKDLKSDDSIFSSRFGMTLDDIDPFSNRYKCKCGHLTGKLNNGMTCEYCKTQVKYISDNFEYTGWICIKEPYALIHPNLFKSLSVFIGKKVFDNIIKTDVRLNEDGFAKENEEPPSSKEPYAGIGILGFKDKVDEILDFYLTKNPNKREYYDDIKNDEDKLFIHSIPVYTTQLRPYSIKDNCFNFEGNNATYNVLAGLAQKVNKDKMYIRRKDKPTKQVLYAMQMSYMKIYTDMEKVLSQKKGYIRSLIGGRYNFCIRNVIIQDPSLEIDQIRLPYASMVEIMRQRLINILCKTHMPSEAYKIWDRARNIFDENIYNLMVSIIESEYFGVILNRNPSIEMGSIVQMRVVGINKHYSCSVPLSILKGLNADFDGDTLNIMYIINQEFLKSLMRVFNPKYAKQISNNDGMFDMSVSHQTDTMVCLNSFAFLARDAYSDEQIRKIEMMKNS